MDVDMGAEQPQEQRWKAKYRALLEEQAANDEHTDLLRQAVIRLSHVAGGQSEDLDDLLQELRQKVRRGAQADELHELISDIDSSAIDLAPAAESGSEQAVVAEAVAEPAPAPVPAVEPPGLELQPAAEQKSPEPAFKSISERIEAVLIDMVSGLKVPESVAESKARIEQTLEIGLNWYELIATLEELSLIVAGTLYEGEKDYASFLQETIGSLGELQSLVKACQSVEQSQAEHGRRLEQQVSASLQSMSDSLGSDNIEDMKSAVQTGLNSIAEKVQEFNDRQESSTLELQENVHALSNQVLQLQQEVASANKQIEEHKSRATTDPLTKLPNRTAYQERLELEYKRWIRYLRPLSLAVADIDFFKKVNDQYGHLMGDTVLRRVAEEINSCLRQTDFAARYGGEEFVLLLPETNEENASIALNKLRQTIQALEFKAEDVSFGITMSFGLTAFRDDDNMNMAFVRADQALYAAKQQGRNRCVIASEK